MNKFLTITASLLVGATSLLSVAEPANAGLRWHRSGGCVENMRFSPCQFAKGADGNIIARFPSGNEYNYAPYTNELWVNGEKIYGAIVPIQMNGDVSIGYYSPTGQLSNVLFPFVK